jgi:hypothetical protein
MGGGSMSEAHKHRDVIIAWANGKEIQRQDEQGWFDWDTSLGLMPSFDFGNWRIKPTVVKKDGWVNIHIARIIAPTILSGIFSTEEDAKKYAGLTTVNRIVTVRIEWEEEQ